MKIKTIIVYFCFNAAVPFDFSQFISLSEQCKNQVLLCADNPLVFYFIFPFFYRNKFAVLNCLSIS